jgi:hypothetical protein
MWHTQQDRRHNFIDDRLLDSTWGPPICKEVEIRFVPKTWAWPD